MTENLISWLYIRVIYLIYLVLGELAFKLEVTSGCFPMYVFHWLELAMLLCKIKHYLLEPPFNRATKEAASPLHLITSRMYISSSCPPPRDFLWALYPFVSWTVSKNNKLWYYPVLAFRLLVDPQASRRPKTEPCLNRRGSSCLLPPSCSTSSSD